MNIDELAARFHNNQKRGIKNIVYHVCSLGQVQFHAPVHSVLSQRLLPAEYWLACDYDLKGLDLRVEFFIPDSNRITTEQLITLPCVDLVMFAEIFGRAPKDAITCFVGHGQPNKHTRWAKENLMAFKHYFLYGELERAMFDLVARDNPRETEHIQFHEIGYPKLDAQIQERYDRESILHDLDLAAIPTIMYAPAWDPGGALRSYGIKLVEKLLEMEGVNVLVKLHPASMEPRGSKYFDYYTGGIDWKCEFKKLIDNPRFRFVDDWVVNPYLVAVDVLITDFSGIALEYMVLDRPVVYIDCPEFYQKTQLEWRNDPILAREDERFNAGRNTGYIVRKLEGLIQTVGHALENKLELSDKRKALIKRFLYNPGKGSVAAADKVQELLGFSGFARETLPVAGVLDGRRDFFPFVSVIIPAFNRGKMIGRTLESVINQKYPKDRYEILVVDNNSTDNTREVVKDWQTRSAVALRYLFEDKQGVHYARNKAAREARGEILYYTDDDMVADSRMISEIVGPFAKDCDVASVSGKILPLWEEEPPLWVRHHLINYLLSLSDLGEETIISASDPGVFSCHQALRRDAFFRTGGFHPENTVGEWIGDGETGLNIRLKSLGYKFAYVGKSVTGHIIPKSRMTQEYVNRRLANQGNCDSYTDFRRYRFSAEQLRNRLTEFGRKMIEHYQRFLEQKLEDNDHWHLEMGQIHYWLARSQYELRLLRDPYWVKLVLKDDWLANDAIEKDSVNIAEQEAEDSMPIPNHTRLSEERKCSPYPRHLTAEQILNSNAVKLANQALEAIQKDEYPFALQILDQAMYADANIKGLQLARAVCLIHLGRRLEAISAAKAELSIDPDNEVCLKFLKSNR